MNWSRITVNAQTDIGTQKIWKLNLQIPVGERETLRGSDSGKLILYTVDTGNRQQPAATGSNRQQPAAVAELTSISLRDYILKRTFKNPASEIDELELNTLESDLGGLIGETADEADIANLSDRKEITIACCVVNDDERFAATIVVAKRDEP